MIIATIIVLLPLCFIFVNIIKMGLSSLSPEFFTSIPKPPDESGGGVANGLVGSGIMLVISSLIGLPIGILGAVYLSEHRHGTFASFIRFCADVLAGVPSIITGMVAYVLVVVPFKSFSAIAGSVALALIMIPIVLRTAEEQLKMVPDTLREASLALGVPHWRTSLKVILKSAMGGVITGILLSVARIAGETAPLLFTALGNQFWNWKLMQPMAALPLQIFNFAISPYDGWHKLAWGGALVLVIIMFSINLAAKSFGRR
ncbi:MAG: phosphate ABC transporter permease PstA [Desulfuromonadales bacterium]|nr:phosphate ABC transporter permease PstA [Desulfuromonadales bacterium]